jgi:hypothetical protein
MSALGIFDGLWGAVGTSVGYGAAEISEMTGSADKKRAQEMALAQLKANEDLTLNASKAKRLNLIVAVILIVMFMIMVTVKAKKT